MPAAAMTDAERRAAVRAGFGERRGEMRPDEADASGPGFAGLDDLDAAATVATIGGPP